MLSKLALSTAIAAVALAATPVAAVTVSFGALPGNNGDAFTTYTESGYTITKTAGDAFVGKAYGNPIPSVFFGPTYGSSGATFSLTSGGATFTFDKFDYSPNNGAASYTITGFLGQSTIFTFGGNNTAVDVWSTIAGSGSVVDRIVLSLNATGTSANIDNLVFTGVQRPVPEPATWGMMLLGFGAMGTTMRRRTKMSARIRFA